MLQSQGTAFMEQQLGAATARAEQLAKSVSALELSVEVPFCLVAALTSQCHIRQANRDALHTAWDQIMHA